MNTKADLKREQEANHFALCLLMPEEMFMREWLRIKKREHDEEKILIALADLFKVPLSACAVRMAQLGSKIWIEKLDANQ